jgi:glycosyltransferase involved in cell wall biosynthesis
MSANPLRVAHLIHSLGPGGAENVLVELAGAADAGDLEPVFVGLSPHPDPVHARTLAGLGAPVVQLDLDRWDPRAITRAAAVLREHRVQVVHTHLKHADLVGALAGARLGVPVVSTLHVIEDAPATRLARYKRTAGLLGRRRFAARTLAVSHSQMRWYQQLSGTTEGVEVLPNGVADPGVPTAADRARVRTELGVPDDGLLIGSASLMRPEKGHHLLLDAVARLDPDLPVTVALAGDGPLRAELEARVATDPVLRSRVEFLGYRADVPVLLGATDLVLHTSLADALPTTLIHALAVGVPAVATDVGGIPDIVTPETGIVAPTDPAALASAVQKLATDPALRARLGAAGRAVFLERFEARGWVQRLRAVYDRVLTGRA